jgi:hypothetical protein
MFPFSFEWIWDAGHIVFHGGLWYALNIIGLGMTYCVIKAVIDTSKGKGGACGKRFFVASDFSLGRQRQR